MSCASVWRTVPASGWGSGHGPPPWTRGAPCPLRRRWRTRAMGTKICPRRKPSYLRRSEQDRKPPISAITYPLLPHAAGRDGLVVGLAFTSQHLEGDGVGVLRAVVVHGDY